MSDIFKGAIIVAMTVEQNIHLFEIETHNEINFYAIYQFIPFQF